jgi:hypothetical protein
LKEVRLRERQAPEWLQAGQPEEDHFEQSNAWMILPQGFIPAKGISGRLNLTVNLLALSVMNGGRHHRRG